MNRKLVAIAIFKLSLRKSDVRLSVTSRAVGHFSNVLIKCSSHIYTELPTPLNQMIDSLPSFCVTASTFTRHSLFRLTNQCVNYKNCLR